MNKSIEEKFIPYIDQELNQDEKMIVDEYLQNNKEAKLRFDDLKKSRNFVHEAFNEYKNINNDKYIDSLINNYPINSKNNQLENKNLFKKILKNFSLPNFASGALAAGCLSFFAIMSPLSFQTVAFNKSLDETNTMISVKSTTTQIEEILNQKSTTSVSKKLNDIEKIIQQNRSSNDIFTRSSKNLSKTMKIEVIDSDTKSNCIDIIINNTSDKTDYTFCKKDNFWKINK